MKQATSYFLVLLLAVLWQGCSSTKPTTTPTVQNQSILGSWEGCDGRIVAFSEGEGDEIIGRYTELGRLGMYKFTQNEIGYKVTEQKPGIYSGTVKWRTTTGKESWKKLTITIQNNDFMSDNGSDKCSQEMERVQ